MKKFIILFSLFVCSCEAYMESYTEKPVKDHMTYFKDDRTGLCFAGVGYGTNSLTISNVPCTQEVENLIKNGVSK